MGKKKLTIDEAKKLIDEGWYIRKKPSKKKLYITLRKGQKERSVGAYSEEIIKTLSPIKNINIKNNNINSMLEEDNRSNTDDHNVKNITTKELLDKIQTLRNIHCFDNCVYKMSDEYCDYWKWTYPPEYDDMVEIFFTDCYKKININDEEAWVVKANAFYCQNCPAYLDRKMISTIRKSIRLD
jgi:hypothetical protein